MIVDAVERVAEREVLRIGRGALEVARGDHERARLPRDVDERRLPAVGVVGRRSHVDLDAGLVEREARERHVVLPADEPAEPAEAGLDRPQAPPVALAPHEPLVVRGHELAVVERQAALGVVVEERVVERAGALRVDLGDAGDEPDAVLARDFPEPVGGGAGNLDGFLGEPGERGFGARDRPSPPGAWPRPTTDRQGGRPRGRRPGRRRRLPPRPRSPPGARARLRGRARPARPGRRRR